MKTTTIPEAMIAGIEFFLIKGEIHFIEGGISREFCELDIALAAMIRNEIDSDPKALKGLKILGIKDPIEQIKQFIFCRFGEFDKKADITPDGQMNFEYWNCGNRPCMADGLLCKHPHGINGYLTIHETELIREVASDKSNKMIAAKFHRSKFTVDTQIRKITQKLGCFTKAGISFFAGQNNLI